MTDSMPGPMTPSSYDAPRHEVQPHDHAVCVYRTHDELLAPLARFLDDGLAHEALNVFVHSFETDEEAWAFLERARPDARTLRDDELVVVSFYRDAFEGSGKRIDFAHVQSVVESLVARAAEKGRAGPRIFVDASREYFRERREKEWFAFESWLGRRLSANVGLVCAYRHDDAMRPDLFPEMLRTHAYRFDAPPARA